MSYGIIHQFKGATKEQYETSAAAVHPSDGTLPAGQLYHFAGPSADGWVVVAVHDSKESWESLRDPILMPSLQRGIEGGFTAPPEETVFKIDADLSAPAIGVAVAAHGTEPSHSPRGEPGRQPPGVACAAHVFAAHVRADPGLVWTALTDPGQTAAYLYGLAAHSTWLPGDPIEFRLGGRAEAIGRVLHARCHERLSYLLQAGPGDPPVYLTWLLRPAPGGSVVRLEIDEVDHADAPQEAEDVWLPVLAALQLLVNQA